MTTETEIVRTVVLNGGRAWIKFRRQPDGRFMGALYREWRKGDPIMSAVFARDFHADVQNLMRLTDVPPQIDLRQPHKFIRIAGRHDTLAELLDWLLRDSNQRIDHRTSSEVLAYIRSTSWGEGLR